MTYLNINKTLSHHSVHDIHISLHVTTVSLQVEVKVFEYSSKCTSEMKRGYGGNMHVKDCAIRQEIHRSMPNLAVYDIFKSILNFICGLYIIVKKVDMHVNILLYSLIKQYSKNYLLSYPYGLANFGITF